MQNYVQARNWEMVIDFKYWMISWRQRLRDDVIDREGIVLLRNDIAATISSWNSSRCLDANHDRLSDYVQSEEIQPLV